ncbi:hypothetical protein E8E13_008867 [Curvularia kusanoi]|uniref:NAD(P)-binding protein n=1 Tax=Curvularia kusanoi TaxID=90978 RepID=A0A9P4TL18_CURKU|nr:hypothetical protein E8E13_008867 [Curvularia kusanoi]
MSLGRSIHSNKPSMLGTAVSHVTNIASDPLLTGALLYLLTRGPPRLRAKLLAPFQSSGLPVFTNTSAGVARLTKLISVLKLLTSLNVLRRANTALNTLAWSNWTLPWRSNGTAWQFGPQRREVVLITGGSSGFGYEMVKAFAPHAKVVVIDIVAFPDELARLPGVFFYQGDLSDTPALEELCERIKEEHGTVSVLINNAGIGVGKTLLETTNAESQKLFQVNLISHMVLIRAFVPGMLAQRKGHIVTIASMASFVPAPGLIDYCISKVGALYLTEGLRAEALAHYGPAGSSLCTTSIHPSWHATGILASAGKDLLDKHGIVPDPPTRVSEVVLKQVLKGRSGRVCVPRSQERYMGVRGLPRWVQDLVFGLVGRGSGRAGTFRELADEHGKSGGRV